MAAHSVRYCDDMPRRMVSTRARYDLTIHLTNCSQVRSHEASPYLHAPSFPILPLGNFCCRLKAAYILGEHNGSAQKLGWPRSRYRCAVSLHTTKRLHTDPGAVDEVAAFQSCLIKDTLRNSRTDEHLTVLIPEVRRSFHFAATSY